MNDVFIDLIAVNLVSAAPILEQNADRCKLMDEVSTINVELSALFIVNPRVHIEDFIMFDNRVVTVVQLNSCSVRRVRSIVYIINAIVSDGGE
jgi:hypothetical protein